MSKRAPDPRTRAADAGVQIGDVDELRAALLTELSSYLHLPDASHVLAALAAAATAVEPEGVEPVWLYVVAPSSLAKTTTTNLLADVVSGSLSQVSLAGLLGWAKKGKVYVPAGLLSTITHGVITFPDLSTLLAGAQRGGKDEVFAALRRIYDGSYSRNVQAPGGGGASSELRWSGRLTVVGAVTVEIDRQLAFVQVLGERSLYVRVPEPSRADQREIARKARQVPDRAGTRARELATALVFSAQARLADGAVTVPDTLHDTIEDAALVSAYGRAHVPRNSYGQQEITGPAEVEGIGRLAQQLTGLARGLLAIGLTAAEAGALVRKVARDSMPARRLRVLSVLAEHPQGPAAEVVEPSKVDTTGLPDDDVQVPGGARPVRRWGADEPGWLVSPLARRAGMDRKAARRVLEELAAVGLASTDADDVGLPDGAADATRRWVLADDMTRDVAAVFGPPMAGPTGERGPGRAATA